MTRLVMGALVLITLGGSAMAELASDRMSYSGALLGRFAPRQNLPDWMRAPRWCTTDAPPWGKGQTAALINGYADRNAQVLRLGMYWGGLAHYPSAVAPHSPNLRAGTDPLAEAVETVRRRGMHLLAYLNPNAYYDTSPLYQTACLFDEAGKPWNETAYGRAGTRYACSNHPEFARFYIGAIRELVGERGAEGIYVDGLTPHVCYCEHCKAAFKADTGRDLPAGLGKLGTQCVLWEMTSDWDILGDVRNPDHLLYSRWLMKRLTDITRLFAEAARSARPDAVVVFHSWPKPDNLPFYDGTLNEIYANRPWRFTLWKRAEFSNWGDVFAVPSLVNIYLRQEPWGGEKREVTSEVEARHLYWQALANGAYPNAWGYLGAERPFAVMKAHADCFDFPTTFPTRFLALPRPMFADARHQQIARETQIPLRAGKVARLRIWEREPNGRIDLLCLRADGKPPADDEYRAFAAGRKTPGVLFLDAAGFDPARSVVAAGGGRWQCEADAQALSGKCLTSTGHALAGEPRMPLEFALPAIEAAGPWSLWARVRFPNVGADSFYWQVSSDDGRTWFPEKPRDECAVGWEQPQQYGWVRARMDLPSRWGADVDRFLSPPAGMFAGLLHAGIPVKQMHPNHITAKSLEGFRVLVLANEVALSDAQCRAIREFVRAGGGLIATHETSLYDLDARRRRNFGLADVFGVSLAGMAEPAAGQALLPQGEMLRGVLPAAGLPNREEHLLVRATTAKVVATLAGAGWPTSAAPAPVRPAGAGAPAGGAPAVLLNTFGKGRVVYLPGRPDSSYSRWADAGTPALIRFAVQWAAPGGIPAAVDSPDGPVGVTCFDQPARNRRLVHLVAYNADGSKPFDALPPLENVKVTLSAPAGKRIASVRAVLSGESLAVQSAGGTAQVVLKRLQEYEVLEVKWGGG